MMLSLDHAVTGGPSIPIRPYESPAMLAATGTTIRPGGFILTERALGLCAFEPGGRVLDIGCGAGATVELMIRDYRLDATGIDLSTRLVSLGRERVPNLPLVIGDATRLPFADGLMDGVFMECVLSSTGTIDQVLTEAHRVLRSGGRLVLTDTYPRKTAAGSSCLVGAWAKDNIETGLRQAGFRLWLWEDHTYLLKQLTAEIILEHGSLAAFWKKVSGIPEHLAEACPTSSGQAPPGSGCLPRLGYYLAIATRD
jgi:arsenite methyltransferase